MISAFTLLVGFGLGIWQHKYIDDIFKNFQKGIYLSEKANIVNRKKELQDELERLTHGD
jgi:hypothetical protein